ncbi:MULTISPECIES: hypothetical protein [Pseudonocardia]|uniref:Uncharacterized protein n=2 Tax=Pseudonocardia TaxID=1847 RepID=A0A1Y2N1H2_PSEAH|nr:MULTISPECIES: hypothetical protein [Pseudonocardia]OSY40947.1 hypothetical protein BG845_02289 [Pseudonocardia autotrophica]TDN73923.1 hypothetical protein C8E95_3032 [Pseudonocardia autotrophica]BBG04676.1 hypothetical protein Pdca_58850 [Pseudonocardia autotrophica]GEC25622.1 hypothetical protein PSA01_26510 [Pseudonocardia saturnea]
MGSTTTGGAGLESLWLDVQMWQPLRGVLHPISEIECDIPDPLPEGFDEWHDWAEACLLEVARRDGWQHGRYTYTIQERDGTDHPVRDLGKDVWDYE